MQNKANNKILLFGSIFALLLLVMVYVNFIAPIRQELADKELRLEQQRNMARQLENRVNISARMKDEDKVRIQEVRRQIPEKPYTESILNDMRRLEVVSNLQFKQYQLQVEQKTASASAAAQSSEGNGNASSQTGEGGQESATQGQNLLVPIRITAAFTGTYKEIRDLLQEMENLDRVINVDTLQLTAQQNSSLLINSSVPIEGNMTWVAYYTPALQGLLKSGMSIDYKPGANRDSPYY